MGLDLGSEQFQWVLRISCSMRKAPYLSEYLQSLGNYTREPGNMLFVDVLVLFGMNQTTSATSNAYMQGC